VNFCFAKKNHVCTAEVPPVIRPLTLLEKQVISILQNNLSVTERPFYVLAKNGGLEPELFLRTAAKLKDDGIIRRYAAILNHRDAGYVCNAMTVWKGSADLASCFIGESAASHVYLRRTVFGGWDYPLFAMIHARTNEELDTIITSLSQKSNITEYQILRSVKEFKKERVNYFSPAIDSWLASLENT
jgi:DNA-binding Lrp family transcriptional regulator